MSDIVLINPDSPFLTDPKVMPPLGMLYIASALREAGYSYDFVDLAGAGDNIVEIPNANIYGITATTAQFPQAWSIKNFLKGVDKTAKVVIGGPHATLMPQMCVANGFDMAVKGEGEVAVDAIIRGNEQILDVDPIVDLDNIPFPDRTLVLDYNYRIDGKKATTMMTSRGCPYNCSFCSKNWSGIRFRSASNVLNEADEIVDLDYEAIMFYDDEILFRVNRDKQIFSGLNDRGLIWRCFSRADLITKHEDVALFMANNGCREILIGVESGSDEILNNINKQTTSLMNRQAIKILHDAGIRVKASMIIGLPGESPETLKETWQFCVEMEEYVSDWDFSVLIPYPGSDIYNNPDKYDVGFEKDAIYKPFKMDPNGNWESVVWTLRLTQAEITQYRRRFHDRFKKSPID